MKIHKFVLFLITTSLFCNCNTDNAMEGNVDLFPMNCLQDPEPKASFLKEECDTDLDSIDSTIFCEIISVGEASLSDRTKEFLPFYCLETGMIIEYINDVGEILAFTLKQKDYFVNDLISVAKIQCEDEKVIGYCLKTEFAKIYMETEDNIGLLIELNTRPDIFDVKAENYGDILTIVRNPGVVEMSVIIDPRSLSHNIDTQEFYTQLTVGGNLYNEVFSHDISSSQIDTYKYYYNKDFGLFAFEDEREVTWVLKM